MLNVGPNLTHAGSYLLLRQPFASGVTTDPADPAMRGGGRGLWGAKNYGINFFTENLKKTNADVRCDEQISMHILVHAVSVRFSLPFFLFLVILNLHDCNPRPSNFTLYTLNVRCVQALTGPIGFTFHGPSLPPSLPIFSRFSSLPLD